MVSTGRAEQDALKRRFYSADSDEDITAKFLAELSRIASAKVLILGIPSDVGAGFRRGANLAPQAIRTRLLDDDPNFTGYCHEHGVVDIGDVFVVPQLLHDDMLAPAQIARSQQALYPDVPEPLRSSLPVSPLSIAERALKLALQINPHIKPLMLGGDHSTAWPMVKAMHEAGRRFCIVQLDAHTDLLRERLGVKICFATWSYHANELIGRGGRMIQVGIRATRHPREHWEETLDVRQFWPEEHAPGGDEKLIDAIVEAALATKLPVYVSNDIDGTDAEDADATGTPEPNGLRVTMVQTLIERLGRECTLMAGDIVEVAPLLGRDEGRRTVEVAAQYVRVTLHELLRDLE